MIDYNNEIVTIQHFTKFGKKDGIIIAQISDIQSVDFEDTYGIAMQYVIDHANELDIEDTTELLIKEGWRHDILNQVIGASDVIISIEINGDNYHSGFVKQVTETDFTLLCIGTMGENEGFAAYKVADITNFKINDLDNRKRLLLYNWRNSKVNH